MTPHFSSACKKKYKRFTVNNIYVAIILINYFCNNIALGLVFSAAMICQLINNIAVNFYILIL